MISENNNDGALKRAYHQPEFHIYGSINSLTAAISPGMGMNDNGGGGNQKSQPA